MFSYCSADAITFNIQIADIFQPARKAASVGTGGGGPADPVELILSRPSEDYLFTTILSGLLFNEPVAVRTFPFSDETMTYSHRCKPGRCKCHINNGQSDRCTGGKCHGLSPHVTSRAKCDNLILAGYLTYGLVLRTYGIVIVMKAQLLGRPRFNFGHITYPFTDGRIVALVSRMPFTCQINAHALRDSSLA